MSSSNRLHRHVSALALLGAALFATACEDEAVGPDNTPVAGELTVDASSQVLYTYVTFADGGSEVTVTDPYASTDWDIAFRRFFVKLNGGVAGGGDVAGANLMNNASADSAAVVNFTLADADDAWDGVTIADTAGVTFQEDEIVADVSGPWFSVSFAGGGPPTLVANPAAAWKADEFGTGYAVFRVIDMSLAIDQSLADLTLEIRHQDAGGALGSPDTLFVDVSGGGTAYVDLAAASVVTDSGCNWDLSVDPAIEIDVNASCSVGTFPLDATEDFSTLTDASDAPAYGGFLATLSGAFPTTFDDATGVFWYNLEGNNRLWPTFNVFLVRVGTDIYKVQVTDFYDSMGDSGYPTVRFELLE